MKGNLEWFYFKVQTAKIVIEQIYLLHSLLVSEK